jgi:hypothetical protein
MSASPAAEIVPFLFNLSKGEPVLYQCKLKCVLLLVRVNRQLASIQGEPSLIGNCIFRAEVNPSATP